MPTVFAETIPKGFFYVPRKVVNHLEAVLPLAASCTETFIDFIDIAAGVFLTTMETKMLQRERVLGMDWGGFYGVRRTV